MISDSTDPTRVATEATELGIPPAEPPVGQRYQPLSKHAEGGLGEVYRAHDRELGREIALKRIRADRVNSMVNRQRFLLEAEITARLEHPGVVPVHGLVTDDNGRPCYAMRFIEGETLAAAIERFHRGEDVLPNSREFHYGQGDKETRRQGDQQTAGLSLSPCPRVSLSFDSLAFRQLLQRFITVSNTIAYAHSRGVLHRDLKPSNIMLGKYGETLVVDWGLAKSIDTETRGQGDKESEQCRGSSPCLPVSLSPCPGASTGSTPQDGLTQAGQIIGTPSFMAPEQAAGEWQRVGPASDIYSLGATLYMLLTARPPFEGGRGVVIEDVKQSRFVAPRSQLKSVPRALEAVCLKAMAKDPGARYVTALALAADLERWLADEAVRAYREPWLARLRRWGRRHRTAVTGLAVLVLTALFALGVGMWKLEAEREETRRAEQEAEIKARTTQEVAGLLQNLFRSADPVGMQGVGFRGSRQRAAEMTARQLLDAAAQRVTTQLADNPGVQAALLDTLGDTYRSLGLYAQADSLLTKALALCHDLHDRDHIDTATTLFHLGWLRHDTGQYDDAQRFYRDALAMQLRLLGPEHLVIAETKFNLAWLLSTRPLVAKWVPYEDLPEAEQLFRDALTIRRRVHGENHRDVGLAMAALAAVQAITKDAKAAEAMLLKAMVILDQPQNASELGSCLTSTLLGNRYLTSGRIPEALREHRRAAEIGRDLLGDDHPLYGMLAGNYAATLLRAGELKEAEKWIKQALDIGRKLPMRSHPVMLEGLIKLADGVRGDGRLAEAEGYYREVLEYGQQRVPGSERYVADAKQKLDDLLRQQGKSPPP